MNENQFTFLSKVRQNRKAFKSLLVKPDKQKLTLFNREISLAKASIIVELFCAQIDRMRFFQTLQTNKEAGFVTFPNGEQKYKLLEFKIMEEN